MQFPTIRKIRSAVLMGLLAVAVSPVNAMVITKTDSVFVSNDNSFTIKLFDFLLADFGGGSTTVSSVTVTVDYSKCGSGVGTGGCTGGPGNPFANEIGFALRSPGGTNVSLIENNGDNEDYETGNFETFASGGSNFDRIVTTFDDAGAALGSAPASGVFAPEGSLGDFAGESALGVWEFFIEDDVGLDPIGVYSVRLDVTVSDGAPVPVPAPLVLMGLGLGLLAGARGIRAAR